MTAGVDRRGSHLPVAAIGFSELVGMLVLPILSEVVRPEPEPLVIGIAAASAPLSTWIIGPMYRIAPGAAPLPAQRAPDEDSCW